MRATSPALLPAQCWPAPLSAAVAEREALPEQTRRAVDQFDAGVRQLDASAALESVQALLRAANQYVTQHEPWKQAPAARDVTLRALLDALRVAARLLSPAIPQASARALSRLGMSLESAAVAPAAGTPLGPAVKLFPR